MRVSWTEQRINDCIQNEVNEVRRLLSIIKDRKWNMNGYVLRHEGELLHIMIDWKINVNQRLPRTSYIK